MIQHNSQRVDIALVAQRFVAMDQTFEMFGSHIGKCTADRSISDAIIPIGHSAEIEVEKERLSIKT